AVKPGPTTTCKPLASFLCSIGMCSRFTRVPLELYPWFPCNSNLFQFCPGASKYAGGQAVKSFLGLRDFFLRIVQRALMRFYNLIISSRQGSCPRRPGPHALEIVQDLAGQWQKRARCFTALHRERDEQLSRVSRGFHQREHMPGGQCR